MTLPGHILYLLAIAALALCVPNSPFDNYSGALITVGMIGLWRYGWAATNIVRAMYYQKVAYPRRRRAAEAEYQRRGKRNHAFFLVTTYKIPSEISARVYRSVFEAACHAKGGASVIASIVDESDRRLIRQVMTSVMEEQGAGKPAIHLQIDKIPGTGKRDALATSLRSIAALNPGRDDVILLVDGDSCVPIDVVDRSIPFFSDPAVGAVTTDERSETQGSRFFRDWFELRFAQRHVMMSSMALSERVLTLTGRMSVFRASLATETGFIDMVRNDYIDHWRLGRVQFLTGDDKSTWFWLLKRGYKMLYLPDLLTTAIETQPKPGFFESAGVLMIRWFGNMLRTNGRALSLGPSRIGYFTWWSILDQAVSIWTTLAGPASVLLAAVFVSAWILPVYLSWVMLTRYVACTIILGARGRSFPISYPFLLYFSQIGGALIKSFVLFRLDRQKWTRQTTEGRGATQGLAQRWRAAGSTYMHALAVGWLVLGIAYIGGLI